MSAAGTSFAEKLLDDSRDEVILYDADVINVFTNGAANPNRCQYNFTHCRSMY